MIAAVMAYFAPREEGLARGVWQGLCQSILHTENTIEKYNHTSLPLCIDLYLRKIFRGRLKARPAATARRLVCHARSATEQTFQSGTVLALRNGTGAQQGAATAKRRKQRRMAR
jgi:hypothetical protein